jgi:signal peptidase I
MEDLLESLKPEDSKESTGTQETSQEKIHWGRLALDIVETIVLAVLLFLGINTISARVRVDGFSMRPTLEDGEFVLVNRLAYRFGDFQRGDIIVFHFPMDPSQELIKRIIGLPGDTIKIENNTVQVNGQTLNEPYIAAEPAYSGTWQVPEGKLFVLGDNRNDSSDSHSWGLLPEENVIGKAVLIYWPPPLWNVIQHTDVFGKAIMVMRLDSKTSQ